MKITGQSHNYTEDMIIEIISSFVDGTYMEVIRARYPDEDEKEMYSKLRSRASSWCKKMKIKLPRLARSPIHKDWERIRTALIERGVESY